MGTVRGRVELWIAVAAATAAGIAAAAVLGAIGSAGAQSSEVRVNAQQLLINQRIAQVGVRRANEALQRLDQVELIPGPVGPAGPAGPQGEAGPPGPAGPSGGVDPAAVGVVLAVDEVLGFGEIFDDDVSCPLGQVSLSGGVQASDPEIAIVRSSYRTDDGDGWHFVVENDSIDADVTLTLQAICVAPEPALIEP